MPKLAIKLGVEDPYSIPNRGPVPKIDIEEGLPLGTLDIAWVDDARKNDFHWSRGLQWHERLHAHQTLNSARRNVKCKRPFEPKDELDFVLEAAYCPTVDLFSEKTDPYLQIETALGEDVNLIFQTQKKEGGKANIYEKCKNKNFTVEEPKHKLVKESWRLLRNRMMVYPERSVARGYAIQFSNGALADGTPLRRENIYNVKLGIAADHSPQTNPGYSRTPSGAFYSI